MKEKPRETLPSLPELEGRAAALVAACFIMLSLIFSPLLGEGGQSSVSGLMAPAGEHIAAAFKKALSGREKFTESEHSSPGSNEGGGVDIRVAEVDPDVSADVRAILVRITAEVLDRSGPIELGGEGPKVLIYHTHDTEAYTQTDAHRYEPSGDWRTYDESCSVFAVGEELARILNEEYGIETIHDTTRHEQPLITTAYTRSLETMRRYQREYPSIEMFIDLHRDGVGEGVEDDFVLIDGREVARLMFVVGTGQSGTGPEPLPDFESNYALAVGLTQKLLSYDEGLARKVRVKTGRYNQQVSSKCILVEVGHNANTLEQALAAMPYLAAAIAETAGIEPAVSAISFAP